MPPSGLWPPRPRSRLASQGSAGGHAPRRRSPAALAPPPATGQRPRPRRTAHPGCPTGTAARPPPRLEGCRHGARARRRERRGNPRTRPPSGLPLSPGRHACLSHCPPARYAAPDPPPQSTPQPGTAGPVASRLSIYSPAPLGRENGGQPLKCTKRFPGDPLNYVSGPCTIFFPYKVGHLLGPEVYIERTWSKFGPFHVTLPPNPLPTPPARPPRHRPCAPRLPSGGPGRPVGAGGRRRAQAGAGRPPGPAPTANWPA